MFPCKEIVETVSYKKTSLSTTYEHPARF